MGCNATTEDNSQSKKTVLAPQPVLISGKNIFNLQNGSIDCFHDRAGDREFDIACHLFVKHEDGSKTLADFISTDLQGVWSAPEADKEVQVSNLNCSVVHGNLGYRCHLITSNVISADDAGKYHFAFQLVEKQTKTETKLEDAILLADRNDRIPPEVDTILIDESLDALNPEGLSLVSGNNAINNPFGDAKSVGLMAAVKITHQAVPTPVLAVDPIWFDNLDEEGNEKISLQCKQVPSPQVEANGEVPFAIRCEIVASNELKNTIQGSVSKIEGYSFPEGSGSNRLSCSTDALGYLCLGTVLKENLEVFQNEKPFARVELKLSRSNEFRLFTKTTSLAFSRNSVQ